MFSFIGGYLKNILFLLGKRKKKLYLMFVLFFMSSFLDLFGLSLIGIYIGFLLNPELLSTSIVAELLIGKGYNLSSEDLILFVGLCLVGVFFIKFIFGLFVTATISRFSLNSMVFIRLRCVETINSMPYLDFISKNSSEFIQAINMHVGEVQNVLRESLTLSSNLIVSSAILFFLFITSPYAVLLLVFSLSIIWFGHQKFLSSKLEYYGELSVKGGVAVTKAFQESLNGMKDLKILGTGDLFSNRIIDNSKLVANNQFKKEIINAFPRYVLEFFLIFFLVSLILFSTAIGGSLDEALPLITIFAAASVRLMPLVGSLLLSIGEMSFKKNAVDMTSNLLKDYENKTVSMSLENKASLDQVSFEKLDIKDVSFRYPTRDDPTLFDINLTIKKGEAVGIIGPSGSGKSTLIDLLLGFLEPDKGEILLNNSSIFNDLNKWRDKIAFMPQQVYLIDDSIVRNVALGLKDDEIDYSQINKSLEAAQLIEYIKELPDGYRTLVGERGAQMSGGQRQRIALARAFYFGRDILILDEATSSLDNETEKEIIKNIKSLKGEKTLIVIAHRLSTLVNCDRVYEIGGGNIINEGTYEKVVLSKD
jgi:ABC-type multidrug transport system fused ATPase/permease subunit